MDDADHSLKVVFFLYGFLVIGVLSKRIVSSNRIPWPHHACITLAGIILGSFSSVFPQLKDPMRLESVGPIYLLYLYIAPLMFDSAFNTEVRNVKLTFMHVLVVVLPIFLMSFLVMAFIGFYTFPYDFTMDEYILMMSIIMSPAPQMNKAFLQLMSANHDLKLMLATEATFGNCIAFTIFKMIIIKISAPNKSLLLPFFFSNIGGMIIGFIIGKIVVYWLSKIFKDHVNHTTIILAFIYFTFAFCQLTGMAGFLGVVTLGLVMANKKASMSTQSTKMMSKFFEVIIFAFASVACVTAGIYVTTKIFPIVTLKDIVMSIIIFILTDTTRSLVLIMVYPLTKRYIHRTSNLLIMCACNLRGSYSVLLSFTLLDKNLYPGKDDKLFMLIVLQIIMSYMINFPLSMLFMEYINKTGLQERSVKIQHSARSLMELKASVVHQLHNSLFTADADWDMVNKHTMLKEEFLKNYRLGRFLGEEKDAASDTPSDQEDANDMRRKESINQIVLSEKSCYKSLFEHGILTKQAVINLMVHVNQALQHKRLIDPKAIIDQTKIDKDNSLLCRIKKDLAVRLQSGLPNCAVLFNIYIFYLLDMSLTVYTALSKIFRTMNPKLYFLINIYNLLFAIIEIMILFAQVAANRTCRLLTMFHLTHRILVAVTLVDLVLVIIPSIFKYLPVTKFREELVHLNHEVITTADVFVGLIISTRLLRAVQLIQFTPVFQKKCLKTVLIMIHRNIFIGCDMASGFIMSTVDTLKKISSMAEDSKLAYSLRFACKKSKLMMLQHLGLSQIRHRNVMLAMKSRTAVRLTLNSLENTLQEIKDIGLLEDVDYLLVKKELDLRMIAGVNFPYSMRLTSQMSLLSHIPWIDGDYWSLDLFLSKGETVSFVPGSVIVTQGTIPNGIYVILSGMVRIERAGVIRKIPPAGQKLRKVPYYTSLSDPGKNELVELSDFLTMGCVIGESAILTGKPSHKTFRCASFVECFYVSTNKFDEVMDGLPNPTRPMSRLEERMWKTVAIRRAVRLILCDVADATDSRMQIYDRMSDSYILDGNFLRTVNIRLGQVSAIILIQGFAKNHFSGAIYTGPCIIPYYTAKLTSLPEKGPRVVYLVLKSRMSEVGNFLEMLMHEDTEEPDVEDDRLSLSSGTSHGGPPRRHKSSFTSGPEDESVIGSTGGRYSHAEKKTGQIKQRTISGNQQRNQKEV